MTTTAEKVCPRCGCGMESGWQYASCADFPDEQPAMHRLLCTSFADDLCPDCDIAMIQEIADEETT